MLPDISTLKISELKKGLQLYGIDITGLSEKQDLISALKTAREALPRPPPAKDEGSKANNRDDTTTNCCAECGKVEGGDVSLKLLSCKACKAVKYCGATCQRKHWSTHKKLCKLRAAELRDKALFKDPPAKEDCPICFLPMPDRILACISLPPATITSVPISITNKIGRNVSIPIVDYAGANQKADKAMEVYYSCCGKNICKGCVHSFFQSGNANKCPFCNTDQLKSQQENKSRIMKRVNANDAVTMRMLAQHYYKGENGFPQDQTKAMDLYARSADLGCGLAHYDMGGIYEGKGDYKKAKFNLEAAVMAGHEGSRTALGRLEFLLAKYEQPERALKHWTIAASSGCYSALYHLNVSFGFGRITRETMESIVAAYNSSCVEMRSEARDAYIRANK